jgi:hypothetical protein
VRSTRAMPGENSSPGGLIRKLGWQPSGGEGQPQADVTGLQAATISPRSAALVPRRAR